jgi:hypothetical protein
MAVRTPHNALGHLISELDLSVPAAHQERNIVLFVSNMIEIQHHDIILSAVHAWMRQKVFNDDLSVPLLPLVVASAHLIAPPTAPLVA